VLLVLYDHAPQVLGRDRGEAGWWWHGSGGAWIGVDLFFVLSGFLITTILLNARGEPGAFRRFWLRRALRILPLAWLYLLALAACAWLLPHFAHLRDPAQFGLAFVYGTNVDVALRGWSAAAFGILWSLSVEEHFYLAWPLLALRAAKRTLWLVLLAVVVGTPLLRWALLDDVGRVHVYVATWCRWDALAAGALLALVQASPFREHWQRFANWLLLPAVAWIGAVLAVPFEAVAAGTPDWFFVVGYSGLALAFTVVCTIALEPPRWLAAVLTAGPLVRIGRISYGLYVWHVLAAELVTKGLGMLGCATTLEGRAGIWLLALFAIAAASWRWFEAPLLAWKDRIR
jgi:peptidoglycan/LPS O-acetylase OafA/YrhL